MTASSGEEKIRIMLEQAKSQNLESSEGFNKEIATFGIHVLMNEKTEEVVIAIKAENEVSRHFSKKMLGQLLFECAMELITK